MPIAASLASPPYPTALGDREWAILALVLPPAKPGGPPRSVDLRLILDGLFHVLRSGCQWRLLPREYGPWSTVYAYFRAWRLDGTHESSYMSHARHTPRSMHIFVPRVMRPSSSGAASPLEAPHLDRATAGPCPASGIR
jgi:putative transposase